MESERGSKHIEQNSNNIKTKLKQNKHINKPYWTPLTSHVEDQEHINQLETTTQTTNSEPLDTES